MGVPVAPSAFVGRIFHVSDEGAVIEDLDLLPGGRSGDAERQVALDAGDFFLGEGKAKRTAVFAGGTLRTDTVFVERDGIVAGLSLDGLSLVAGEITVVRAVLEAVAGVQRPVGGHGEQVAEFGGPAGAARTHEGESGDGRIMGTVARRWSFDVARHRSDVDHPEWGQDAGGAAGRRMGNEVFLGIPVIRIIVAAGGDQGVHAREGIHVARTACAEQQRCCKDAQIFFHKTFRVSLK